MAGHTRLFRRGGVYYHRAAVPVDIQATYQKTEETFSLKTKDHKEALKLVRKAALEVDRRFDLHRQEIAAQKLPPLSTLTEEQLKTASDLYYWHLLDEDNDYRLEGFHEEDQTETPRDTFDEAQETRAAMDDLDRSNQARGKTSEFYIGEAHEVATWEGLGIRIAKGSIAEKALARILQETTIKARQELNKRDLGDIVETPVKPSKSTFKHSSAPLLSAAVEEWVAEKARTSWTSKTEEEKKSRIRQFINVAGDKPIDQYNKEDARTFKQVLLSIPANWTKLSQFTGLSMSEAASSAKALGMQGMKDNTVKKAINSVSAFWNWAVVHYDYIEKNPLRGMNIKVESNARDERYPFTLSALNTMFKTPIYTGCKSLTYWKEVGNLIPRDNAIFWVPLIGLFTGARMGEVLQLYVSDIKEKNAIHYFDINKDEADKRLKTKPSERLPPIHTELIKCGFLDFVGRCKQKGQTRLFEDVALGSDGYYSSTFSKHFARFLIAHGLKEPKIVFHSFRHNFEDACRNSGVPSEHMDALQGHSEKGMKARYGNGFALEVLNASMQKICYKDLNLEHLFT